MCVYESGDKKEREKCRKYFPFRSPFSMIDFVFIYIH